MADGENKKMWQKVAGCGCLSVIIAPFCPPLLFVLVPGFIIYFIIALIKTPFLYFKDEKRRQEDKLIAEKFEKALWAEQEKYLQMEEDSDNFSGK